MAYLVHTQRFEGPLGLLLYLIRKEEMDIFDINVVEITRQYLDYIKMMKELDLEVAGDFVSMAATLLYIKSRMLLPQYNEEGEIIETEDPRKELVQKLLEYQKYQDAGQQLYSRPLLNRDVFARGSQDDFLDEDGNGEIILEEDGLFSLIGSYRKALRQMKKAVHNVRAKVQSIASRVMEIKDRLVVGQRVLMHELVLAEGPERRPQLLITFLSMLELGRMGFVSLFQSDTYGDIHVEAKKPIEGNVLERVQEFDSADSANVAQDLFAKAEAKAAAAATEEQILSGEFDEVPQAMQAVPTQLSLSENGDETLNNSMAVEEVATEEIASDEDILAAEAELGDIGPSSDAGSGFGFDPEPGVGV